MRRLAGFVAASAALCAAVAVAAVPKTITQTTLGGAPLGKPKAYYIAHFGTPYRLDRLENNYERLVFSKGKVEVYFRSNALAKGGAGIVTWSKTFRTVDGVGPCSSLETLESAYGDKLKPYKIAGKIQAYWVGRLLFATQGTKKVTAVTLTSPRVRPFIGLSSSACA